jgi:hypothetical protein
MCKQICIYLDIGAEIIYNKDSMKNGDFYENFIGLYI